MNRSLSKSDLIIVLVIIGLLISSVNFYFQIKNTIREIRTSRDELHPKPTVTYCGKSNEVIEENGDWQLISAKGSDLDFPRGLYLKNTKDPNKLKILGTTDPFLYKLSAVFLDQGNNVLFIQTQLDEEKRLYPQKEKLVFYSIAQNKVYKEIPREKFLELLTKEDRNFANVNSNLANLRVAPDNKRAAVNLTNLTEPNGWLFIIDLQNGKIISGPSGLVNYIWKDNRTIEYEVRVSNQADEKSNGLGYFEKRTYIIDN